MSNMIKSLLQSGWYLCEDAWRNQTTAIGLHFSVQNKVGKKVISFFAAGRENGKKSRKPRISESMILNDGSCASISLLF